MNMSRSALVVVLLWVAFSFFVWSSSGQLPDRVATHFRADGVPNGWMTRTGYLQFTLIFGLLVPAFVLGIFSLLTRSDDRWLNLPNKEYWLAPERREETLGFIQRQGFWVAGMLIAFFAGIHWSTLGANARTPIALPMADVGWVAGPFLIGMLAWGAVFIGRFFRRPA